MQLKIESIAHLLLFKIKINGLMLLFRFFLKKVTNKYIAIKIV